MLVSVNDVFVTDFNRLESTLDDCVGKEVQLTLDRAGTEIKLSVIVQDLHAITPARFLECAGGIVHALSYQQARNFALAAGSAYVAEPGYLLGLANVTKHAIIVALDNQKTPDLNAFAEAFGKLTRRVEANQSSNDIQPKSTRQPSYFVSKFAIFYITKSRYKHLLYQIRFHKIA